MLRVFVLFSLFLFDSTCLQAITPEKRNIKSIAESYYSPDKILKRTIAYTYEKSGNLLEEKESDAFGKIIRRTVYSYDSQDRLSEKSSYGSADKLLYRSTFTYDREGKKIECRNFVNNEKFVSKTISYLNDSGKVIRYDTYTDEGGVYNSHSFKYTNQNQVSEETIFYPDGMTEWRSESIYDTKGKLIEKNEFPTCCLSIKYQYLYNDTGNLLLEKSSKADGSSGIEYSYKYPEVDDSGNWLLKIISENEKLTTFIKREIAYFTS